MGKLKIGVFFLGIFIGLFFRKKDDDVIDIFQAGFGCLLIGVIILILAITIFLIFDGINFFIQKN